MRKRIGVIMYQTSASKGQELVAQRMVRNFIRLGESAFLITGCFHDGKEVVPTESLKKGKGYLYVEDRTLKIPIIHVDSYLAKWPPRRIAFRDFTHTLGKIVDDFDLNVLITHSTLWNGPDDTAQFVAWRREMREMGGYQDPLVMCHMSHFQEPTPLRYSLPELTYRTAWNRMALSRVLDTANLVLVVTPLEKAAKVKIGAKPEKCLLYPGGIDDETFTAFAAEDAPGFMAAKNIPADTRVISYLGSIEERKNPMAVVKAAQKMTDRKDIHFVLAGRGDNAYAREVEKLAKTLPNVSYVGEITEQEKVALLKISYLNIIMSRLEALGIVQLESMYFGVPVVTSAAGGQTWMVQDGVEGKHLKGPEDIEGAVKAITALVDNPEVHAKLSANARQRASQFTLSGITTKLDEAIDQELIRDCGLSENLPSEISETMQSPEQVLKTWRKGRTSIIATSKRIFISKGLISRSVIEARYQDMTTIEHNRVFPWKTPLVGAGLSALLWALPFTGPIFDDSFENIVRGWIASLLQYVPPGVPLHMIPDWVYILLPLAVSLIICGAGIRSGFRVYGPWRKPIKLPGYKDIIGFIRDSRDTQEPRKTMVEAEAAANG